MDRLYARWRDVQISMICGYYPSYVLQCWKILIESEVLATMVEGVVVFSAANQINGEETTVVFDMRVAVVFGVILGVVAGVLSKVFKDKE